MRITRRSLLAGVAGGAVLLRDAEARVPLTGAGPIRVAASCPSFALDTTTGTCATNWADYRTEGLTNQYFNAGSYYSSAAAWWASRGTGSTFARASSAFGVPSTGLLTSYATNAARRPVVDPSNISKGLGTQYEGARTNLALHSDIDSGWTASNGTLTLNNNTAPDGTGTAALFVDNSTNSTHRATDGAISAANGIYTFSVYLKAGTFSQAILDMSDGATGDASIGLNLSGNGSTFAFASFGTGSWTSISGTVTAVNNSWYRATLTATKGAGSNINPSVYTYNGATASYSGAGNGFYIWGAQLEAAAFPSSYIATTTSSVTRAADSQSLTRTAPTSITKVIAGRTPPPLATSAQPIFYNLTTSGNIRWVWLQQDISGKISLQGGPTLVSNIVLGSNVDFVAALTMSSSGVTLSVNGETPVTSATAITAGLINEFEGKFFSGSEWYGTIKGTAEFTNVTASNAALQALSGSSYWN